MIKRIHIFIFMLAALATTACTDELEVDIEGQEPKVTLMSCVEPDSLLSMRLTYSRFFLSNAPFQTIDDAVVSLSVNGVASPAAVTSRDGYYTVAYRPQVGDRLALNVTVPGHGNVSATTTVPAAPVVTDFSQVANADGTKFRFTLHDPADVENYYIIRLKDTVGNGTGNYFYRYFRCQDYLLTESTDIGSLIDGESPGDWRGDMLTFTDGNINGRNHVVELSIDWNDGWENLFLEITSYSRDRYLYEVTSSLYSDDLFDNLFNEPVQIHTNVDGGIGIFAARNCKVIPLNATHE